MSAGLGALGFACVEQERSSLTSARVCTRIRNTASARVRMLVTTSSGAIRQVSTTVDEDETAQASHARILEVVADAVGLAAPDRKGIQTALASGTSGVRTLGAGTFVARGGVAPESQLRLSPDPVSRPSPTPPTFAASVDALAAAAHARGYICQTPQVPTIRSCSRAEDGYFYQLWMDGTATSVSELALEVTATHRTQTRRRWHAEIAVVLSSVDTDQGRRIASWLAQQAEAPGADGYVGGLAVSFFVRTGEYVKETFGGVRAQYPR